MKKNPSTVIKFVQSSMYAFYFHLIDVNGRNGKLKMVFGHISRIAIV
jgi:hypothetical protein